MIRSLFIITETMTKQQLDNQYLLSLAMLNFDHQVTLVFTGSVLNSLMSHPEQQKKWLALKMYGVDHFYQLTAQTSKPICDHSEPLNHDALETLKANMDFLS